jgi:hypothetical protein
MAVTKADFSGLKNDNEAKTRTLKPT